MSGLAVGRPRARRERHRLRPRGRLALRRAAARGRDRARDRPRRRQRARTAPRSSTRARSRRPTRSAARPELHRADLLGELTRLKPTIAISGTHGKTTTSSMVVHALAARADPSYLVGGEVRSTGANAGWGTGEWLVVEADESDRSLLKLAPDDRGRHQRRARPPHDLRLPARRRRDVPRLPRARRAAASVPAGSRRGSPRDPTSSTPTPELTATGSRFDFDGITVTLPVPGAHNARNAAAALTAIKLAGGDVAGRRARWRDFEGAGRRFERLGTTASGALVVDDYAHHPTEVRATIEAARTLAPRRVIACFQPHLYSRTQREATRVRRRRWRSPTSRSSSTSTPPASTRRTSRASPACSSPRPTADAGGGKRVAWMRTHAAAESLPAQRIVRAATCC